MTRRRRFDQPSADEFKTLIVRMSATELAGTLAAIVELEFHVLEKELSTFNAENPDSIVSDYESQRRCTLFLEAVASFGGQQLIAERPGHSLNSNLSLEVAAQLIEHPNPEVRKYAAMFAAEAYEADDLDLLMLVMATIVKDESYDVRSLAFEHFCAESNLAELPLDYYFRAIRSLGGAIRTVSPYVTK